MFQFARRIGLTGAAAMVLASAGCQTLSKKEQGAIVGAGVGGAVGAVVGNQTGSTARGAPYASA